MNNYIEVYIQKPVYGSFCYVRDKYLKQAKREGKLLKISCPDASCIVSWSDWLSDAKRMEKVFLQPTNPMVLYGNSVSKFSGREEVKAEQRRLF